MIRDTRKMNRTLTLMIAALLVTGIAAADSPDIPAPGLTPDSPFYPFEKMSERLELAVAQAPVIGSEQLEAKVRANHAAERLSEARAMAEKNRTEHIETLMERYSENMNRSIESASNANRSELKNRLKNVTDNQNRVLGGMRDKMPEQARKGIEKAMENNRRNQAALKRGDMAGRENPGTVGQRPETGKPETGGPENSLTGRATDPGTSKENKEDQKSSGGAETTQDQGNSGSRPDGYDGQEEESSGNRQNPDMPMQR